MDHPRPRRVRAAPGAVRATLATLALAAGCAPAEPEERRPNVLLISIDTLRADHLGCYGYGRATSPRIDALAAEGALFEQAISTTSWTLPAHAALLTGLADSVHGCTDTDRSLAPERRTLAERLAEAGYATAGFFSGPYLHPVFGLSQGFETWVDCTSYSGFNDERAQATGTIEGPDVWRRANDDVTNPTVLREVSAWLRANRRQPFLLFAHLWDVHFDFVPPAPYDTLFDPDYAGELTGRGFFFDPRVKAGMPERDLQHLIALYDGEIAWTDRHVGRILEELDALGLAEDTLVVVTADHGTAFFEHGRSAHRNALFDELLRVPLVMRLPGGVPAGVRVASQVSTIDVVPTVLDLLGLGVPADVMGRSLVPALGGAESDELAVSELATLGQEQRSFRRSGRKLIVDGTTQLGQVFDLARDPGEQQPVARATDPAIQAAREDQRRALLWLEGWRAALPALDAGPELPAEVLGHLKSLGYVGDER